MTIFTTLSHKFPQIPTNSHIYEFTEGMKTLSSQSGRALELFLPQHGHEWHKME